MKLKVYFLGLLLIAFKSSAQVAMAFDGPGYEVSHSMELPGKQLFGFTHNLSLGQLGFRFADRATFCIGYKLSMVQNKYNFQEAYFKEKDIEGSYISKRPSYHSRWFPIPAPNFQIRYRLKRSMLGEIELGFGSMMRFTYLNSYRSYSYVEEGTDIWNQERRTYGDIKRYELASPLRRVLTHTLTVRKYFGNRRVKAFVEPFINITQLDLVWRETSAEDSDNYFAYNSNFQPFDTRIIPEFGIKFSWNLDLRPGFVKKLDSLFQTDK